MQINNSPVDSFHYHKRTFYVKRDDLLDQSFNGNKARKLAYFLNQKPGGDLKNIDTLISYGGYQSNLMYALSALARLNDWRFIYYTSQLSKVAKKMPDGNLAASLKNKMELIEVKDDFKVLCQALQWGKRPAPGNPLHLTDSILNRSHLLIMQGGAQIEAGYGIKMLADEIRLWAHQKGFSQLAIFSPSGTGTTALFLQTYLPEFTVYTTNCVGSSQYLQQQFEDLAKNSITSSGQSFLRPKIFNNTKFRFATPYTMLYENIMAIHKESQIAFDLIYDPVGWTILLENLVAISEPILYLHCGGLLGNESMRKRYTMGF